MTLPTPEDPRGAPVWENYLVAQLTHAALGLLPRRAVALGVEVNNYDVTVHCQLSSVTVADQEDLTEIASELATLVGDDVHVRIAYDVRQRPIISPHDGVRWIYAARSEE